MDEIVSLCRPEIYAMKPYSSARTESGPGVRVLLDANESPYPPYPATADVAGFNRYPDPQPAVLLDGFADLYAAARESLFVSRGADEAIDLLVRAFCAAGKDSILITPPTFVMYETAAEIQGAAVRRVPLRGADFQLDMPAIGAALDDDPSIKIVFLCSPNNPTSNLMHRSDVLHLCARTLGRALVVVDELYVDYSRTPSIAAELGDHPNLVVLRSMSKEYSLAGERIGVTIAHPEVVRILLRVMAPYSLTASSVRAAAAVLSAEGLTHGRANIDRVLAERDRVALLLKRSPLVLEIFPSDANFLLVRTTDASGICRHLEEAGIRIRDRSGLVEGAVRISIGLPEENDAMLAALADHAARPV
ncbi:histidinol-phosphate transaminase [Actinoplanes missouriensis]|uniref:histidinol-phosphate transaminase n=1 Tax=Actinoplanes missouriensis TaxID=1866 RepID=UPI0033DAADB1